MMDDVITAPFTLEQVRALNAYQGRNDRHPFTCRNRGDGAHVGESELVARIEGWICIQCGYTQDWAYPQMAGLS